MLRIELEEQRSRSIHMMEEKDAEIQRLQHELEKSVEEVFYSPERYAYQNFKHYLQKTLGKITLLEHTLKTFYRNQV